MKIIDVWNRLLCSILVESETREVWTAQGRMCSVRWCIIGCIPLVLCHDKVERSRWEYWLNVGTHPYYCVLPVMSADCQQRAEHSSVWFPFHESASAVTHLYRGAADVCLQCIDCGVHYGQRRKTRDIISWVKKKKRLIKREELLAFLLDKPEPVTAGSVPDVPCPRVDELNELTGPLSACCFNSSTSPSPRRRMVFREDRAECDVVPTSGREIGRKRSMNFGFESASGVNEFSPLTKRIRF